MTVVESNSWHGELRWRVPFHGTPPTPRLDGSIRFANSGRSRRFYGQERERACDSGVCCAGARRSLAGSLHGRHLRRIEHAVAVPVRVADVCVGEAVPPDGSGTLNASARDTFPSLFLSIIAAPQLPPLHAPSLAESACDGKRCRWP